MLPVLKASVHDVQYSAALLWRQLSQREATITVTKRGFITVVEEARTLLGMAYIFSNVFDEYDTQDSADDEDTDNNAFEVPLNTLIECPTIFGTAGGTNYNTAGGGRHTRCKKVGDNDDGDDGDNNDNDGGRGRIQQFFGGGSEKRTGMSYTGISTYDAEPHLELPFDLENRVLKNILKATFSEWLRDALSELDPSCEKLTEDPQRQKAKSRVGLKPMLRIQATGTFSNVLETFDCAQTISFRSNTLHTSMRFLTSQF
ncbi:Rad1/Rec1/Rad17 [Desarmillaria tabescens]|uniref:Rad1/Rec1/Rad17 n=1 Tax=Armillaria tabescens TaxID=1929756 RepID=A0AA39KEJ4_ARMTA|nr:Rad1/Rec1/Rad17 [Desarmillaria tabescens]KAK0458505.1 Rad1/Rec1/Rad17 [Desarmillaria tabescens]